MTGRPPGPGTWASLAAARTTAASSTHAPRRLAGGSVGTVGADHGVEVHQSPSLQLGHLGVGEAQLGSDRPNAASPSSGEAPADQEGGAVPQAADRGVPQDRPLVVEAPRAQRLTGHGIAVGMDPGAGERHAVGAAGLGPPGPARSRPRCVDGAERRCRQRHEEKGVGGHRLGDALPAAQPRRQQVPGVAPVAGGTGQADGRPPVLAGDADRARPQLPGRPVDGRADQAHRVHAAPARSTSPSSR